MEFVILPRVCNHFPEHVILWLIVISYPSLKLQTRGRKFDWYNITYSRKSSRHYILRDLPFLNDVARLNLVGVVHLTYIRASIYTVILAVETTGQEREDGWMDAWYEIPIASLFSAILRKSKHGLAYFHFPVLIGQRNAIRCLRSIEQTFVVFLGNYLGHSVHSGGYRSIFQIFIGPNGQ